MAAPQPSASRNRAEGRHTEHRNRPRFADLEVERRALSVDEVASSWGVGKPLVEQLIRAGDLAAFRIGRRVVVPVAALDEYEARQLAEAQGS
jgi:excisionase family DNA binding protein